MTERIRVGIGRLIGLPSMIGDGKPPAMLSSPFRLNTIFIWRSQRAFRTNDRARRVLSHPRAANISWSRPPQHALSMRVSWWLRFLVALPPSADLLLCAKYLFSEAIIAPRAKCR